MKKLNLALLLICMVAASAVKADVCDDAFLDFATEAQPLIDKNIVTSDDAQNFSSQLKALDQKISNESCYTETMALTEDFSTNFKNKRIETLKKYKRMGIKEEAGKSVSGELDFLMGVVPPVVEEKKAEVVPAVVVTPPAPAATDKCGSKILENEAVNLNNVRDQDSVGWCYAYAAADLLSYKLNQKISAVSLYNSGQAIEADIKSVQSQNGGDMGESIDAYLKKHNGLCLEEDLPSSDFKFCADKNYAKFLNNLIAVAKGNKLEKEISSNQCFAGDIEKAFPGAGAAFIKEQSRSVDSSSLVESLYDSQCQKVSFPNLKVGHKTEIIEYTPADDMLKTIDEQIKNNSMIGISYDHRKLNDQKGSEGHASVIVGKRLNPKTGSCDYMVRNSWGKTCTQKESRDIECHKNCTADGCRYSGNFWVSAEKLKSSLNGVMYLK